MGHLIKDMWEGEKEHRKKFDELLPKYQTRPTAMLPIWNVAGYLLGAGKRTVNFWLNYRLRMHVMQTRILWNPGTALFGPKMAMACTAAVETVIADHYNNQIRQLMADPEANGELLAVIKKFRDDEMHHHDLAVANEAEKAPMYQAVSQAIQFGCRGAIWISERI